jgi:hypothetical protein
MGLVSVLLGILGALLVASPAWAAASSLDGVAEAADELTAADDQPWPDPAHGRLEFHRRNAAGERIESAKPLGSLRFDVTRGALAIRVTATGLQPDQAYSLVFSAPGLTRSGLSVLGSATSSRHGRLTLKTAVPLTDAVLQGRTVTEFLDDFLPWLVPSPDLESRGDAVGFATWNPEGFLFTGKPAIRRCPEFAMSGVAGVTPLFGEALKTLNPAAAGGGPTCQETCDHEQLICQVKCQSTLLSEALSEMLCKKSCNAACMVTGGGCGDCLAKCPSTFDPAACTQACDSDLQACLEPCPAGG